MENDDQPGKENLAYPGQSGSSPVQGADAESELQIPRRGVPTLGGMQFWGDLSFRNGWKIQRHVYTGHCRLIDPSNYRFASGTREYCERTLAEMARRQGMAPDAGRAVILLHGIGRTSNCFAAMTAALRQDGFVVVPFEYPSTRVSLEQSADYLRSVISSLDSVSTIDFVVHSMGGLVVRSLLGVCSDDRLHSMVMLGTPNAGAELADMLKNNAVFSLIYGPAGQQLVSGGQSTISQLPVPNFPFGIIAGGKGDEKGFNPLLPGDDDGTVTVASARLAGAVDFLRVPRIHAFLMSDSTVIQATRRFLQEGRFREDAAPEPIS